MPQPLQAGDESQEKLAKRTIVWYNVYMLITKGYKYRIYPNKTQAEYMNSIFGSCRFVYNYFLALRSSLWKEKKESISPAAESRMLTLLKRSLSSSY